MVLLNEAQRVDLVLCGGCLAVGKLPLVEDQAVHRREYLPRHGEARYARVLRYVARHEVPIVHKDIYAGVIDYPEPFEGVEVGAVNRGDCEFDLRFGRVVSEVEGLVDAVE